MKAEDESRRLLLRIDQLQNSYTTLSFDHRDQKTECTRISKAMKDAVDAIRDANADSKRQLRKEMDAFRVEILQTKPIKQSDTESAPL